MKTKSDLTPTVKAGPESPLHRVLSTWKPRGIEKPQVTRQITHLHPIERSAEVLRYSILRAEWWISPTGRLRQWLRLNLLVSLYLSIPALLIVPVVTYFLNSFVTWTILLVQIGKNLLLVPLLAIAGIAVITGLMLFLRLLLALARR